MTPPLDSGAPSATDPSPDRVVLSANAGNASECIHYAARHGLGIEVMAFAYPNFLNGTLDAHLHEYAEKLRPLHEVRGFLSLHGPFIDLASGSPDPLVDALTRDRYHQGLNVAAQLGARVVVFHANFIASLRAAQYREGWRARNIPFWRALGEEAGERGLTVAVENMWEFEPEIIAEVLDAVAMPTVRACLDVGHARLFSDPGVTLAHWLDVLAPYLIHTHLNNNDGLDDVHRPFPDPAGVLDYHTILNDLRALPNPPTMVLEMNTLADMVDSLPYFHLAGEYTGEG